MALSLAHVFLTCSVIPRVVCSWSWLLTSHILALNWTWDVKFVPLSPMVTTGAVLFGREAIPF